MKPREKKRLMIYLLLPVLGAVLVVWYIYAAGADVVYSDYIRIINSYLPDVGNLRKFLVPDVLTRIPVCFVQRYINVKSFAYSVTFDRLCTAMGLFFLAGILAKFCAENKVRFLEYTAIMAAVFSLSKWEVLLNGTCWAHVLAISLFFLNYYVFDIIWKGESDAVTELLACAMPFLWLLTAGEYLASYCVTMILLSFFGAMTGGAVNIGSRHVQRVFLRILFCTLFSLALYLLSRHFAVWEHAGAADMTLPELMKFAPSFLPKLFLRSFSGMILGEETMQVFLHGKALPDAAVLVLGGIVLAGYAAAFLMYVKNDMMEKTVFPLLLLISGFLNHVLVTMGRWIFLNERYTLSSRYAVQFMVGICGMLLIFALYKKPAARYRSRDSEKLRQGLQALAVLCTVLVLAGALFTTANEIHKAQYRKANYDRMADVIREYESVSDEELCSELEWRKDPEVLKNALRILKENNLNVFDPMNSAGTGEERKDAA